MREKEKTTDGKASQHDAPTRGVSMNNNPPDDTLQSSEMQTTTPTADSDSFSMVDPVAASGLDMPTPRAIDPAVETSLCEPNTSMIEASSQLAKHSAAFVVSSTSPVARIAFGTGKVSINGRPVKVAAKEQPLDSSRSSFPDMIELFGSDLEDLSLGDQSSSLAWSPMNGDIVQSQPEPATASPSNDKNNKAQSFAPKYRSESFTFMCPAPSASMETFSHAKHDTGVIDQALLRPIAMPTRPLKKAVPSGPFAFRVPVIPRLKAPEKKKAETKTNVVDARAPASTIEE